jgi:hypothetical protein
MPVRPVRPKPFQSIGGSPPVSWPCRDTGGLVFTRDRSGALLRDCLPASLFGGWQHWTLFVQAEPTTFVAKHRVLHCNIASVTIVTAMAPVGS